MYHHTGSTRPTHISAFLKQRLEEAKQHIEDLPKGAYSRDTDEEAAKKVVDKYKLTPLALGKHTAEIKPNTEVTRADVPGHESLYIGEPNYRDMLIVSWPVTGSTHSLLGLFDSSGNKIAQAISRDNIKGRLPYAVGHLAKDAGKEAAKNDIIHLTNQYKAHFERINADVEKFNQLLGQTIPPLLNAKLKSLRAIDTAEDFLNF